MVERIAGDEDDTPETFIMLHHHQLGERAPGIVRHHSDVSQVQSFEELRDEPRHRGWVSS
nr:hypothetical protein [Nocardia sp. CNY236]